MAGRGRPRKNPEEPVAPRKKKKKDSALLNQSNYFTFARYSYTATEKRILYRVLEQAWKVRKANLDWFDAHNGEIQASDEHIEFTMPIANFMTREERSAPDGRGYQYVYEAFKALHDKDICFKWDYGFTIGSIVNWADWNKGKGTIHFEVNRWVWAAALNFARGFTPMDIVTAMNFRSPYTMRFYELISNYWKDETKSGIFRLSLDEIRTEFNCQDKYKLTYELKRRVIEPAKKELDESSPLTFTYGPYPDDENDDRKRKKIEGFTFIVVENDKVKTKEMKEKEETKVLTRKYPFSAYLREVKNWLVNKMGFDDKQLAMNAATFFEFQEQFEGKEIEQLEETFQYIQNKRRLRPQNNPGMFVYNIKMKTDKAKSAIYMPQNTEGQKKINDMTSALARKLRSKK